MPFNEINSVLKKEWNYIRRESREYLRVGLMWVQNLVPMKDFLVSFLIPLNLHIVESESPLRRKLQYSSFEIRRHHSNYCSFISVWAATYSSPTFLRKQCKRASSEMSTLRVEPLIMAGAYWSSRNVPSAAILEYTRIHQNILEFTRNGSASPLLSKTLSPERKMDDHTAAKWLQMKETKLCNLGSTNNKEWK